MLIRLLDITDTSPRHAIQYTAIVTQKVLKRRREQGERMEGRWSRRSSAESSKKGRWKDITTESAEGRQRESERDDN